MQTSVCTRMLYVKPSHRQGPAGRSCGSARSAHERRRSQERATGCQQQVRPSGERRVGQPRVGPSRHPRCATSPRPRASRSRRCRACSAARPRPYPSPRPPGGASPRRPIGSATGPIRWRAGCAARPPCSSASSSATSLIRSSREPSKPHRWRPTAGATTWSSGTRTTPRTRPSPSGASWRRGTATPSSSWATCATDPASSRTSRTRASRWSPCGTAHGRAASRPSAWTIGPACRRSSTTSWAWGIGASPSQARSASGTSTSARPPTSHRSSAMGCRSASTIATTSPTTSAAVPRRSTDLMDLEDPPTAIVAPTDVLAIGMLHAAHRRGMQVPRDVSVSGFDDIPVAAVSVPALTTVRMPTESHGRGRHRPRHRPGRCRRGSSTPSCEPELVIRASTGPVPGRVA